MMICVLFLLLGFRLPLLAEWQEVEGRDRVPTYRVDVPTEWTRIDPSRDVDLSDSREAIVSFEIDGVTIAIHSFPSSTAGERIPARAQVDRWQRQFDRLAPLPITSEPVSFAGYAGLHFFAEGERKGEEQATLGWSLLLDPDHYRALGRAGERVERRSDITIKVTGSPSAVHRRRQELELFAESFEQIEGIPQRL